jgi:predicted ATP-grasp superfamily ATP-dependent carboligase
LKPLVCIGFAEALSAPEVAWSLVDDGCDVIAIARKGRRSALRHSARVQVFEITAPETDAAAALADLTQVLANRNGATTRRVLLPLDDAAVWLCDQLPSDGKWILAGPRQSTAALALNKDIQTRTALACGFNVPATTIATKAADVLARAAELPLVLRPANAVLPQQNRLRKGRNWICATRAELEKTVSDWAEAWPMMIQPFIRGTGEGVFGLATNDGVQAWSAHRRLRMMNPHGSGSSACVSQSVPSDVQPAVEKMIQQTGWRGLFMVELIRDQAGKLWFVEFNGRPWGSMALSRRQGLEYPAWAVKLALNQQLPARPPANGTVVCRNAGREFMHLLFVLRGPKSAAFQEWPSFWRTAFNLLSVHRHDSLYNWRADDLKVFFSDWWYTVRDNVLKSRN